MKLVFSLCVCVLVCFAALVAADDSATPTEPNCQKYSSDACTREYIPLCGDNGKTYSNECMLCVESRNKTMIIKVMKRGEC